MGILKKVFGNTKKPEGFWGKLMVDGMNRGHAPLADWGMSFFGDIRPKAILDCGCGGGRNVAELLKRYPQAEVTGLDYSEVSVKKSQEVNAEAVAQGRCRIVQGDVSALPFADGAFDLVTAFETIYFWPGPERSFSEVFRVLKKGGTFAIVNEADGKNKADEKWTNIIDGMKIYGKEEIECCLYEAGFTRVEADHSAEKHWLTVRAVK
ncbi:MAG: class I SAM-dependent methyltransferase [Candidatus Saccharimonas sp.]